MPETQQEQPDSIGDNMILHILANPIHDKNLPQLPRFLGTEPGASNETPSRHQATNTSAGSSINTLLIHESDTTNFPTSPKFSASRQSYQESGLQQNTMVDSDNEFDLQSDSGSSLAL